MPFFLVDDKVHSHRKVRSIPRAQRMAAMGLWSVAGAWCRDTLSDGVIPEFMIDELGGTLRQAEALVRAGLWESHPGGFSVVHWSDWQDTRATVEKKREAWRNRQGKARGQRRDADPPAETENVTPMSRVTGGGVTRDSRVSHGGVTESSSSSLSSSNSGYVEKETHVSSADPEVRDEPISQPVLPSTAVIARRYTDRVQLCDRAKVCGVVQSALNAGYTETQIGPALERLAADGRPVTPDTLRIEIDGMAKTRASPAGRPSTTDQRVANTLDLAQRLAEKEAAAQARLEIGR